MTQNASSLDAATVAQLVLHERQCRDRGRWDQLAACYVADSIVEISWFTGSGAAFAEASRGMVGSGDRAVHRLSPPVVDVVGDRAVIELPMIVEFRVDIDGTEADLASFGRGQFRAERRDGRWLLVRFTSVYERDTLLAARAGERLEVDPAQLAPFRPAYRNLAWYLGRRGHHITADLLGDDELENVARHYEAEQAWLGISG